MAKYLLVVLFLIAVASTAPASAETGVRPHTAAAQTGYTQVAQSEEEEGDSEDQPQQSQDGGSWLPSWLGGGSSDSTAPRGEDGESDGEEEGDGEDEEDDG